MVNSHIIILTGERGIGKTTFCQTLMEKVERIGGHVTGVLSSARFKGETKVGIDIINIATKQKYHLAKRKKTADLQSATPGWEFDQEMLSWGNTIFDLNQKSDLLIVDELGPMELVHNKGWLNGIKMVNQRNYQLAIVVIRPKLINIGKHLWPESEILRLQSANNVEFEPIRFFKMQENIIANYL